MEKEIRIKYPNGELVILPDRFFPASKSNINKLLKTVWLVSAPDVIVDTILETLLEIAAQDKHTMMQIKAQVPKTYNQMCETRELVASAKCPFGVRLTDAEYKDARKELRRLKEECKRLEREFDKSKRHRERGLKIIMFMSAVRQGGGTGMNGTQASKISELSLRAIRQSDIDGMRDKLKIGDIITLSEQDPWATERVYVKYKITAKYKHHFTAEKVKAKGKVMISMSYAKYMIEGKNAYARSYGHA